MNFWNEFLCMKLFTVETICWGKDKLLQQYESPLKKPVCIVTDGSPPMTRIKNEWNHGGKINTSHCVMQQQVLCGKIKRLVDIWKTVVSYVKFVIPGDFIMDILFLFFLILTMNMRICHITMNFNGYPATGHGKCVMIW